MKSYILVYLFFLHFVADFLLQSREMGKKKSEVPLILAQHMAIQFSVVFLGLTPVIGWGHAIVLSLANTAVHGAIDWNIWRLYKLYAYRVIRYKDNSPLIDKNNPLAPWKFWEDHWFYATIGFDQFLHMSTLALLAGVLT